MLLAALEHAAQQVQRRRAGPRRAAGRLRSTRGSSGPPLGHDRRLAGDARQRAEDDVELRVDRRDRALERAQMLGSSTPSSADAERREARPRSARQPAAHFDQRDGEHRDDDHREQGRSTGRVCSVRAHRRHRTRRSVRSCSPSWTTASSTICAEHRRRRLELGDVRGVGAAATLPATSSRPPTELVDVRSRPGRAGSAGAATTSAATSPIASEIHQERVRRHGGDRAVVARPPPSAARAPSAESGRLSR